MSRRRSPMRARLAVVGYGVFYRLPHGARRRIIRLVTPKYIVGAVTMVRDTEAAEPGRLLLLRQPPGRGWTLPAGLLQRKEDPRLGAARELAEETGVDLEPEELTPAVPNAVVHAKGWVDVVFEAAVPASTTELIVDGAEVYEAAWHPLDALPPLSTSTARLLAYYGIGPKADQPGPWAQARATTGSASRQRSSQQSDPAGQQARSHKPAAQ